MANPSTQLKKDIEELILQIEGEKGICIEPVLKDADSYNSILIGAENKFSAASIIKLPILLEFFLQTQSGLIDPNREIVLNKQDMVGGCGVLSRLSEGIKLPLIDLATLMIIVSDNTATNLMIDIVGRERINQLNQRLNLKQTILNRKLMGKKSEQKEDNYTCAGDVIKLLKLIDTWHELTEASRHHIKKILLQQQLNHKLPAMLDSNKVTHDFSLAHKTGELPGVEHNAGIFTVNGNKAYVCVLMNDLNNNYEGQKAIAKIGKLVYDFLVEIE